MGQPWAIRLARAVPCATIDIMPTPFMHMALARRLIADPYLPPTSRDRVQSAWGAFLLGSVAPDARISSGLDRANTHFFEYGPVIDPSPVDAMLNRYSELRGSAIQDGTRAVFMAGYAAHLAMDAVWATEILYPYFIQGKAGTTRTRYVLLHMLLGYLDRRDRARLTDGEYLALSSAVPDHWLPFVADQGLAEWRDAIASQIAPGAPSRTLDILSQRMRINTSELAALLDSESQMALLWSVVSPSQVASVEEAMYDGTRREVINYLG